MDNNTNISIKTDIFSTEIIHHDSTCSAYRTLAASFNIQKREESTNVQYQQGAYWSRASEHKYKALNGRRFHSWLGKDKQWSNCKVNSHTLSAVELSATWRTSRVCVSRSALTGKIFRLIKSTEKLHVGSFGVQIKSFCFTFKIFEKALQHNAAVYIKLRYFQNFLKPRSYCLKFDRCSYRLA